MEIWKRYYIDQEPTRYEVSNYGRVRNTERLNYANRGILKGRPLKNGYIQYCLYHRRKDLYLYAHRLVGELFLDTEGLDISVLDINHIDGNKTNNHYKNLEWCTRKENMKHAVQTQLMPLTRCRVYDLKGTFIKEYKSISDAGRDLIGKQLPLPSDVLNNPKRQSLGYQWRTDFSVPVYDISNTYKQPKRGVIQYSLDGEIIATYSSITECMRILDITNDSRIRRCCNGLQDTYRNSRWAWL